MVYYTDTSPIFERNTVIKGKVMAHKSKSLLLFGAAVFLLGVGFVAGMAVSSAGFADLGIFTAQPAASDSEETVVPQALHLHVKQLKAQLEESQDRVEVLEAKMGKGEWDKDLPDKSDKIEKPKGGKAEWAKKKKGGKAWAGKKDWKPGLPEGMTREEQDARVQEIVDRQDWPKYAGALVAWSRADRGERGITLPEKEVLGEFFGALGELTEVGVEFFDRRVARRFVPAMVSSLGANLDEHQAEQITGFVDQTARQEENQPEPNPPLRYAQEKARDIQNTMDLEARMESILRPEQFQEYLAEVGDDPFRSGFGFKTQRMACTGKTPDEVAEQVVNLWAGEWYGLQAHRAAITSAAQQFVSQALALPVPNAGLEPAARRRAILERTKRALELQGNAEQQLLATLPLSEEERLTFIASRWPVLDLVIG
jgi:hypothetical protein